MKFTFHRKWTKGILLFGGLLCLSLTGCQTNIAGQTLPSAYFLRDDVQFYPAGPETKLINQIQALEEYKIQQQENFDGFGDFP